MIQYVELSYLGIGSLLEITHIKETRSHCIPTGDTTHLSEYTSLGGIRQGLIPISYPFYQRQEQLQVTPQTRGSGHNFADMAQAKRDKDTKLDR